MKKYLIGGAAAAAMVAGGAVFAQTAPQQAPRTHLMKTETRAEAQARVAKMFARLDVNHDGFITPNEFFSAAAWSRLDPTGAGYITAWPWT